MADGAESELQAAAGVSGHGIPLELWDVPIERRDGEGERETRAITPSPGTTGVNLDPIRPAVFANSITPRLGIEMPRVKSGTFASGTITTSQSATALAKSAAAVGAAGAITVTAATPKRISARLELTLEDIATVGQANFESILRENLALALSDQLDDQVINGNGTAPNLSGIFQGLTDPTAAPTAVADFDAFVAAFAGGRRRPLVAYHQRGRNRGRRGNLPLERQHVPRSRVRHRGRPWRQGILGLRNVDVRRMVDQHENARPGNIHDRRQRAASHPVPQGQDDDGRRRRDAHGGLSALGIVDIDDIYSGSAQGERFFTMHVLLGDVIIVQPDAYAQVAFQVA